MSWDNEKIKQLILSKTNFILLGPPSSGKTKLLRTVFDDLISKNFNIAKIQVNCALSSKLYYFLNNINSRLRKYLKQFEPNLPKFTKQNNLKSWSDNMVNLIKQYPHLQQKLKNVTIFFDNIEYLQISAKFFYSFQKDCAQYFSFRFHLIYCGVGFSQKSAYIQSPIRQTFLLHKQKPVQQIKSLIKQIIQQKINEFGFYRKTTQQLKNKQQIQKIQKVKQTLFSHILAAFQMQQNQLNVIQSSVNLIMQTILGSFDNDNLYQQIMEMTYSSNKLKQIITQVREDGLQKIDTLKKKVDNQIIEEHSDLEFYPMLLLSSIHFAEYYQQIYDKKRFMDYRDYKSRKGEWKKEEYKQHKHLGKRIIAISEALESTGKENSKQQHLKHHTIDFYACIQYLASEKKIKTYGLKNLLAGGKIIGISVNQSQVRDFVKKNDLDYSQFMKE